MMERNGHAAPTVNVASMMLDLFRGNEQFIAVSNGSGFTWEELSTPLTSARFERHLRQREGLGIYPLRADGTVWFCAVDFDNHASNPDPEWRDKAENLAFELERHGLAPLVEVSQGGNGAHVWVFFAEPIEAALVRKFFLHLESKLGTKFKEIFPKQDRIGESTPEEIAKGTKKLGNLIRVPLWNKSRFVDYANDWAPIPPEQALASVQRIDPAEFRAFCGSLGIDATVTRPTAQRIKVDDVKCVTGAEPPATKLEALLANDDKFRASWEHNRTDLKDSSGSGYLMSLTNLMVRAHWTDQEITDSLMFWCTANNVEFRLARLKHDIAKTRTAVKVADLRDAASLPQVLLPGGSMSISQAAGTFGELMGASGQFYCRGGVAVRLVTTKGDNYLEPIKGPALCSDLETVSQPVKVTRTKDGETIGPATCNESSGRLILNAASFRAALPRIVVVSRCPVLIERDDMLVTISDFDVESGILASGMVLDMHIEDAITMLNELVGEFNFATQGDKARALAALITPALLFGGLLGGRAPIDLGEANESQAGKGFRNKVTSAIYRCTPYTVTQRSGGVGSLQETFDAGLVAGANFITFDNIRGKLDLTALESFMTEDTYAARIPHLSSMMIDPTRIVIMMTSNAAETTRDLANRCSCTRILKQTAGYTFKSYPEGDLRDHVLANQPRYLGAVFSVVREWYRQGKPMLPSVDHDFRRWARTLGWITEHILGAGPLLDGHREAQTRIASPGLTWLRDVCLAVQRAAKLAQWLRPNDVVGIISDEMDSPGIELGDLDNDSEWLKAAQAVGRKLGKLFPNGDEVELDNFLIERREVLDDAQRKRTEYAFFSEFPNNPE